MILCDLFNALEKDIVSVIDHYGCQCTTKELIDFIGHAKQLSVSEIGRKTYLVFDTQTDIQTLGLSPSFVVMLAISSELPLLTLNTQSVLRLAG